MTVKKDHDHDISRDNNERHLKCSTKQTQHLHHCPITKGLHADGTLSNFFLIHILPADEGLRLILINDDQEVTDKSAKGLKYHMTF